VYQNGLLQALDLGGRTDRRRDQRRLGNEPVDLGTQFPEVSGFPMGHFEVTAPEPVLLPWLALAALTLFRRKSLARR
jgi:hypothetical protein